MMMLTLAALSKKSTMTFVFSITRSSAFARGLAAALADAAASATASSTESCIGCGVPIPLSVSSRRASEIASLPT